MSKQVYVEAKGIRYDGTLPKIKKNKALLQPIFEAFTNALESIKILKKRHNILSTEDGIVIEIFFTKNLPNIKENCSFKKIQITDFGIGFDDEEFGRIKDLNDNRKGYSNKGSGRVQFLHTFEKTEVRSFYRDSASKTGFKQRIFTLSKSEPFLSKNAIIRLEEGNEEDIKINNSSTSIVFRDVLLPDDEVFFKGMTAEKLKESLISQYLAYFCENKLELPKIKIKTFVDDEVEDELEITLDDIPTPDKEENIDIHYSKMNGTAIEKVQNKEIFNLKAFKINQSKLDKNGLKLISKGEIAKDIRLESLLPNDQIDGNRYLFLLSGDYINSKDGDTRGEIAIVTESEFKKMDRDLFLNDEEILMDDIEEKANSKILEMYEEIRNRKEEKEKNIDELEEMFLLNHKTINSLRNKISINDSDDEILKKVYKADVEILAERDAKIRQQLKELEKLDTNSQDYEDKLKSQVNEFVKAIPLQNKVALTQYVARRKLVLDLFDKILSKQLESLKNGGRIDEDVMHNLIFQQSSDDPESSDLWLIEEDFIYFQGFSNKALSQIQINSKKIFKDSFSTEEERYLNSLGEKRLDRKPDILLFPDEGKCIIVEFKAPDVNASKHLTQIDAYASLIRNHTIDEFEINTFYGYLIGENIEDRDVRGAVSSFEHSYHLDYWFKPSTKVTGFDNRKDGSIYTEVIKYSTLLQRAKKRNRIFIDKITKLDPS